MSEIEVASSEGKRSLTIFWNANAILITRNCLFYAMVDGIVGNSVGHVISGIIWSRHSVINRHLTTHLIKVNSI